MSKNSRNISLNFVAFLTILTTAVILKFLISHGNKPSQETLKNENESVVNSTKEIKSNQVEAITKTCEKLKYWGVCLEDWHDNESLRTMNRVFKRMNYEFINASRGDEWDILWAIEYFFADSEDHKHPLFAGMTKKPFEKHQKMNHFPGSEGLVSKTYMNRLNRGSKFILPSFVLPKDKIIFEKYLVENPRKKLLEKNFYNRGVRIIESTKYKNSTDRVFYQEFMDNHFLIDGHAFDFGIFVLITSFDPIRIYRFDDVLVRFCPEKYHPFDPMIRDKYVVQEGSKTIYEMPSFKDIYKNYGFSSKVMFENYISERGHDVKAFWHRIDEAIVKISLKAERDVTDSLNKFKYSSTNFFELVRFDLVLDVDLNPFVLEVNLSPNITPASKRYEEYVVVYEQMVNNIVKMIGGRTFNEFWSRFDPTDIIVANKKNIASDIKSCLKYDCKNHCDRTGCAFCAPCMSPDDRYQIREAFREHQHGSNFIRLFPSTNYFYNETFVNKMTRNNRVSLKWYRGKCEDDIKWC